MRPHDHIGWVFDGPAGFDALAAPFLAEGAERCERLMYIAADPDPAIVSGLGAAIGSHGVQVASIAEVYGATGVVDPSALLATFSAVFVDALAEGYRGIRVAADNTPLVTGRGSGGRLSPTGSCRRTRRPPCARLTGKRST